LNSRNEKETLFGLVNLMNKKEKAELIDKYGKAGKRLVLLDYDGTLVNYELIPDDAILPAHLVDILIKIIDKPGTNVFIISGRSHNDIDKLLGHIPIKIIAEHGAMIKENGQWKNQINENDQWKKDFFPTFNRITDACPKSFVEEKSFSLTWHYRNAEPDLGYECSRELIQLLKGMINSYNLKILDGNKVVEILSNKTGKGRAVKNLLAQNSYDFVLSVGDDTTDEEMFEFFLNYSNAFTIKVGAGNTCARYNLKDISNVELLLKQLAG
jgi:trehalose 6-phosphate synthase/phosphatase